MSVVRFSSIVIAAALALGTTQSAEAGTKVSKSGGVSIDVPDAWKVSGTDRLVGIADPDRHMGLLLFIVDKSDAEKVLTGIDKQLAKTATDIRWSKKTKPIKLNGMKGMSRDGSATMDGKEVLTTEMFLGPTGTGKAIVAFAGADPGWLKSHGAELLATFKSIKPVE